MAKQKNKSNTVGQEPASGVAGEAAMNSKNSASSQGTLKPGPTQDPVQVGVISKGPHTQEDRKTFMRDLILRQILEKVRIVQQSGGDRNFLQKLVAEDLRSWAGATRGALAELEKEYEWLLKLKTKGNKFPYKWMENDKVIREKLRRFPIVEALNCIDKLAFKASDPNTSRYAGGKDYERPKNKKRFTYSIFITDDAFYQEMTKALNKTKNYVYRLLTAFSKAGFIRKIRRVEKSPVVYSDGYFLRNEGIHKQTGLKTLHTKKIPYLTGEEKIKLRHFELWK